MSDEVYAVELRDVVKRFGDVVAVDHVSLQIREGEFFSLLGPSGCGKTTTLRLIAGFEMPTAGVVLIGGEPQGYLPPYRRPVNTVFQHYALFPHMTVYENVAFGLEMQGVPRRQVRQRVLEALDLVQLADLESRRPHQLSGGQQQRVALARALVNRPKVLLLDEPLGALDLKLRKAMQVELKNLQHRVGITFVYVTHDQEEALTMSDRIAVVNLGRVLQVGTPEEIYEHPADRFVADFIGETNFLQGTLRALGPPLQVEIGGSLKVSAARAQQGLAVGEPVVVSVRPEKVRLSPPEEAPPAANRVSGRVEQVVYMGTDTRYQVRLPTGETLTVRLQNTEAGDRRFREGDEVVVAWEADQASALRA